MVGKGHPSFDTIHMIKHDSSCLEVPTTLHPLHQITFTTISMHKHLEQKNKFSKLLSWKTTILNVIITTTSLKRKNAINVPYNT